MEVENLKLEPQGQKSTKWKWILSAVIWYCTFTMGLGVAFIGASLLELSRKFDTDIPTLSKVFTVVTFSFLLGAIICGVAFNYVNRQIASGVLLIVMGVGSIFMPIVGSLPIFFIMAAIVGFGAAGYDTAQIVWIIEMWETHAAPYIQTQHFSYAVGTVVSPLLIKPFLPDATKNSSATSASPELNLIPLAGTNDSAHAHETLLYNTSAQPDAPKGDLHIPFMIGGIAAILGGVMFLVLYCINKYEKPRTRDMAQGSGNIQTDLGKSKGCNLRKVVLILLSAAVLGTYCGMELCTFQFLPTFTHFTHLHLSQQDGALVLSGLASAFTAGRALGIFVVLKIKPEILLLCNFFLILAGNSVLLCFANSSLPALWAGSILLGLGFSTVFPSFYGFIEKHLKVSNVVGAVMIVAGGLVSSLYPIIIGSFIEKNALILMYTNYFSLITCTTAFLIIYGITRSGKKGQVTGQHQGQSGAGQWEPK